MADLYFAQTPINQVLAAAVASSEAGRASTSDEAPTLVAFTRSAAERTWSDQLRTQDGWPFARVIDLDRRLRGLSAWAKWRRIRTNCRTAVSLVEECQPQNVWFFNDQFPSVQAACVRAKACRPRCQRIFLDEGLSSYSVRPYPVVRGVARVVRRLMVGRWWDEQPLNGLSRHIDEARLMFPEAANPAMRCRVTLLDKNVLSSHALDGMPAELSSICRQPIHDLVFLPRLSLIDDVASLQDFVQRLLLESSEVRNVAVKAHPAEASEDPLAVQEMGGLVIDRLLPSELIILACRENLQRVFGATSSATLSAKWICPDAEVGVVIPPSELGSASERVFRTAGVQCFRRFSEIPVNSSAGA